MTLTPAQSEGAPCVFCSNPQIRERLISENKLAWAFPTNIPIVPGHVLISPKRCVPTMGELSADERASVLELVDIMMKSLRESYGAEGFNCVWNEGKLAGQSVPHLHIHVIPRKDGDSGLLGYDPRSMLYRTGDREPSSEEDILEVRDRMRNAIKN